tara:strand:+ start:275 stop:445 length:171 start_codon:yes stop_codon:yes gene_type:complete
MPFKSEKQKKFLFANKPEIARKFAKDSKNSGGYILVYPRGYSKLLKSKQQPTKIFI